MAKRHYEREEVVDLEYGGQGIIKPEGRVVFVEGVLPGEVIDARVTRARSDHAFAALTARHTSSPERVEPFCAHFTDCGGCTWQYLGYEGQLAYKQRFTREIMARIAGLEGPEPLPIVGCERDRLYRNKLEFSFSRTRWLTTAEVESGAAVDDRRALGFHVRGRFDRVLDVRNCYLQPDPSNAIRTETRRIALESGLPFYDPTSHAGVLRGLVVRTSTDGEAMVILIIGEPLDEDAERFLRLLADAVPQISSAHYLVNPSLNDDIAPHETVHVLGSPTITERCLHLRLAIHPKSFYQTNSRQAERLYAVVRDWAALTGGETVLDLYCGIGSIGLLLAGDAARVIGVESVHEAVERAGENAAANGITNASFIAGDVREILRSVGGPRGDGTLPAPDLVVLDPPRAGVHPDVISELVRIAPPRVIYVSCKPATQARDLRRLGEFYSVERVQPVDMFPQTFHIETVVELRRREARREVP